MFNIQNKAILIISFLVLSFTGLQSANAQNGTSSTLETFNDTESGISFQYPSDWEIASTDFVEQLLSSEDDTANAGPSPIQLIHESLDGGYFMIQPEILPFSMSVEKYLEASKRAVATDPSIQIDDSTVTPVSVGGLDGLKYDLTVDDGVSKVNQTQILLVKDSTGYVIGYGLGTSNPETELAGINSIIDSIKVH